MQIRTAELAAAVGGRLQGPDGVVDGATIDSRTVRPGQLFVPVVAERDGHAFIAAALRGGAAAYLASDPAAAESAGGTAVLVDDTIAALQAAGRLARERLAPPVIGITGSVGKTSVKDLLAAVLGQGRRTTASERSFNNELGVPLTLLGAPDGTEAVVVEMGARDAGHITDLSAIAEPTVGIVTRVAAVHTEVFGTIDDVARAKSELVHTLPPDGTAVLNADDERVVAMAAVAPGAVVTFGAGGDVHASRLQLDHELQAHFVLRSPWGEIEVELGARGVHQVANTLAAAAAALVCGVSLDEVAAGLHEAVLSPWRMELERTAGGALVLNDAYNANPTSVRAALDSLAHLPADRRTAVLGVMAELGPTSDDEHAAIGAHARDLGIRIIAVGAPAYGGEDVASVEEASTKLGEVGVGDAVLVKGSRVAGLERLAEELVD